MLLCLEAKRRTRKWRYCRGGERSRLAMIRLLLEPVNLLILDEPTNHLDMRSKDVLKDALREFDGTVILVSHDREFLDGLVDKVYEFGNQRVTEHLGGIYEFLNRKKMDNLQELEKATSLAQKNMETDDQPSQSKMSYESRKEQNRALKKAEKSVAEAEAKIERLEAEQAQLESMLATPEGSADTALYAKYGAIKKELSETMDLWSCCIQELEDLKS